MKLLKKSPEVGCDIKEHSDIWLGETETKTFLLLIKMVVGGGGGGKRDSFPNMVTSWYYKMLPLFVVMMFRKTYFVYQIVAVFATKFETE